MAQCNTAHHQKKTITGLNHGGGANTMLWGWVSSIGTGALVKAEGRYDPLKILSVLG